MSILDRMFHRGHDDLEKMPPDIPMGIVGGETVYADDIVAHITGELERIRDERMVYELQWTMNANFLSGHQNCEMDINTRRITEEESVERRDRERRVYNRIAPIMETRLAHLGSVSYDMVVKPRTYESDDYAKAGVSTKILRYCKENTGFDHKMRKAVAWAELTGTVYTLSWWDTTAGDLIGETERVIADDKGVETVTVEQIHSGDLDFGLVSSYEVFPASLTVEEITDQRFVILEQVRDVGTVYDMYGIRVQGENVDSYVLTPIPQGVTGHGRANITFGLQKEQQENAVRVITYLENPSRDYPKGRIAIVIRDKLIFYGDLPGGVMPLRDIKAKSVSGQFYGKSVIQDLIPLQRAYNNVSNKIQDFIDTVANNPVVMENGAIDNMEEIDENGIESGSVILIHPGFQKPDILDYPSPPPVVENERAKLEEAMEYTAGVSQMMMYGGTPAGVTSGTAIENLRDIDNTRMSLTAENIRDGVIEMAKIWLKLCKAYAGGYRVLRIAGSDDAGYVSVWTREDINSYDVEFTAENELKTSPEQKKQNFLNAYTAGLFTDENGVNGQEVKRLGRELFLNENTQALTMEELQRKYAARENSYLEHGVIPQRGRYDDDAVHLDEHIRYAISRDYQIFAKRMPEYAAKFEEHIAVHQQMLQQAANQEIEKKQQAAMQQMMRGNTNG